MHSLATILCYEVLDDIQCPNGLKCCIESNNTSPADSKPQSHTTTQSPIRHTTTVVSVTKPTQKLEKPTKYDSNKGEGLIFLLITKFWIENNILYFQNYFVQMKHVLANVFPNVLPNTVKHISKQAVCAKVDRNVVWHVITMAINYRPICIYQMVKKIKHFHRNRPSPFYWAQKIHICNIPNNQPKWAQHDHQGHRFLCANPLKLIRLVHVCAMVIVSVDGLHCSVKKSILMHTAPTIWAVVNRKVPMYKSQHLNRLVFIFTLIFNFFCNKIFISIDTSTKMSWLLYIECIPWILWKPSRCYTIHFKLSRRISLLR